MQPYRIQIKMREISNKNLGSQDVFKLPLGKAIKTYTICKLQK